MLNDLINGLNRLEEEAVDGNSASQKKLHTMKSRWSIVKSAFGIGPTSSIGSHINITSQDYQR